MTIKEKIMKIMSLALEINPPEIKNIGKLTTAVFVNWSPHCNVIELAIYKNGWDSYKSASEYKSAYTNEYDSDEHLDKMIARLEEIKKEIEK